RAYLGTIPVGLSLTVPALQDDRGVVAAEAERVRHRSRELRRAGRIRHVVEIALGIGLLVVDRGREGLLLQRQCGEDRLDRAGSAEAVPRRALRRGDRRLPRVLLAERLLDHARLARVAK